MKQFKKLFRTLVIIGIFTRVGIKVYAYVQKAPEVIPYDQMAIGKLVEQKITLTNQTKDLQDKTKEICDLIAEQSSGSILCQDENKKQIDTGVVDNPIEQVNSFLKLQ